MSPGADVPPGPLRPLLDYRPARVSGTGIGRYVRELVRAMVQLDHAPRLFGATWAEPLFPDDPAALGSARLFAPRIPGKVLQGALRATGIGVERLLGGADLVHHTQYRRLPSRLPEVTMIHDLVFLDSDRYVAGATATRMGDFAREAARSSAAILTPSHTVADEVADRLGIPRERVFGTPLGVDHALRLPSDPGAGESVRGEVDREGPYVFTACRIEHRKNLGVVLKALEALGGDAPRWVIAGGDGEGAAGFRAAVAASPAAARVVFLGEVSEAALRARIEGAVAFVLVPHDEGFGLAPLEAMALGTPAITSSVPVVKEVCGGGATLIDPADHGALAGAIQALGSDPEARDAAARSGAAHAAGFTWIQTAGATFDAYRFAVEVSSPSS